MRAGINSILQDFRKMAYINDGEHFPFLTKKLGTWSYLNEEQDVDPKAQVRENGATESLELEGGYVNPGTQESLTLAPPTPQPPYVHAGP